MNGHYHLKHLKHLKPAWKAGWREIGGKRNYYRSRWDANYARYLNWLQEKKQIKSWKYEATTFWFDEIKRGTRSYLIDFDVERLDDVIEHHEVKGYMDAKSKTKLKRMAKYHPNVKVVLITPTQYKAIARAVKMLIRDWEGD